MRVSLELLSTTDDRLEGRIVTNDGRPDLTFSGTLDLLRVLEELRHARIDAPDAVAPTATVTPTQAREERSSCR